MSSYQRAAFRFRNGTVGFFSALGRFSRGCTVISVVMLTAFVVPSVAAQGIRDVPGFWGLRQGNEISVLMASSRRTEIVVAGQAEVTRETSESLQIQYRVVAIERSGDVLVKAIVRKIERQPTSLILTRLTGATFSLAIHPDGSVSMLTSEGRDALVTHLSNGDPESAQVLKKCLTDETIRSWLSVPFWLIQPVADDKLQVTWNRSHDVSLGTLGSLQLDLNFRVGDMQASMAKIMIAGDAHFRPLVLPDTDTAAFPFLSNAKVEIDEVSGTGRLHVASPDADEPSELRPQFESVEWTLRLHGEAQLPWDKLPQKSTIPAGADGDPAVQDVSRKSSMVTFRQTQHQLWTLQGFTIGMPRRLEFDRLSVPIQQLVPVPPK